MLGALGPSGHLVNISRGIAVDEDALCTALEWVSLFARFTDFSSGILSLTGVIYMISFAGVFLLLTVYTTEKRRWSEG